MKRIDRQEGKPAGPKKMVVPVVDLNSAEREAVELMRPVRQEKRAVPVMELSVQKREVAELKRLARLR